MDLEIGKIQRRHRFPHLHIVFCPCEQRRKLQRCTLPLLFATNQHSRVRRPRLGLAPKAQSIEYSFVPREVISLDLGAHNRNLQHRFQKEPMEPRTRQEWDEHCGSMSIPLHWNSPPRPRYQSSFHSFERRSQSPHRRMLNQAF